MSVHQRPKNQTEITTLRHYIVTAPAHGEVSEEIYHRFEYIININKIQSKIYDQYVNDFGSPGTQRRPDRILKNFIHPKECEDAP